MKELLKSFIVVAVSSLLSTIVVLILHYVLNFDVNPAFMFAYALLWVTSLAGFVLSWAIISSELDSKVDTCMFIILAWMLPASILAIIISNTL